MSPKPTVFRQGRSIVVTMTTCAMLSLTACQNPNALAMKIGAMPSNAAAMREAEIRQLDATDQVVLLSDITQALQDLGFTVSESSAALGVVTGTKQRDAEESGQVAGQIALTVAFALLGTAYVPVWDKVQKINITTTVAPGLRPQQFAVRVSFDRYIWNNQGKLWKTELIQDRAVYQEFFERMSHGRTLGAHAV